MKTRTPEVRKRQKVVLALLGEGLTRPQIAQHLGIPEGTVNSTIVRMRDDGFYIPYRTERGRKHPELRTIPEGKRRCGICKGIFDKELAPKWVCRECNREIGREYRAANPEQSIGATESSAEPRQDTGSQHGAPSPD